MISPDDLRRLNRRLPVFLHFLFLFIFSVDLFMLNWQFVQRPTHNLQVLSIYTAFLNTFIRFYDVVFLLSKFLCGTMFLANRISHLSQYFDQRSETTIKCDASFIDRTPSDHFIAVAEIIIALLTVNTWIGHSENAHINISIFSMLFYSLT